MTHQDKRSLMRGMSIARGLLFNTSCDHHAVIKDYQLMLAELWDIDENDPFYRDEFADRIDEINDAIASKYPDALNRAGHPRRRQ